MRERGQGDAKPIVLRVSAGRGPNPSLYADGRGGISVAVTSRERPRSQAAHMDFSGVSDTCVSMSCK